MARARSGAVEGLWIRARRQSGGRGRLGRQWQSPEGNLYASTLVRPMAGDPPLHSLAFVAALAVHDLMAPYCADGAVVLKWPNDVLLSGAKACGMLLESAEQAVVVGIGINVGFAPDLLERATAALAEAAVRPLPGLDLLMHDLATHFSQRLHQWRLWPIAQLYRAWVERAHPIGASLSVTAENESLTGTFAGLGDDGSLRLMLSDGTLRQIYAGDVAMLSE